VRVGHRAAVVTMFVRTINTETVFRVQVVDVAAAVIMSMFFSSVARPVKICGERAVTVLVVCFEEVIVVVGLRVTAVAEAVVHVNNVVALVNIERAAVRIGAVVRVEKLLFFFYPHLCEVAIFGLQLAGQRSVLGNLVLFILLL